MKEDRVMLYVVETRKDVETAAWDLQEAVKRNFGAADLKSVAEEVERETARMIDEVR